MVEAHKNDYLQNVPNLVSVRLKNEIGPIMTLWCQKVRQVDDVIKGQSEEDLRNALGHFLEKIADIISTTSESSLGERFAAETIEICKEHGLQRAAISGYTLDLVIIEYRILRKIVFEVLEKQIPINVTERQKLLEAIDNGISEAAIAFTQAKGLSPEFLSRQARANLLEFKTKLTASREETKQARGERDDFRNLVNQLKIERGLRERFVATLTHDLKTPITTAKLSAELLIRKVEDTKSHLILAAQIVRDLERIDKMIGDLLDSNRISSGEKLTLTFEKFDLSKLAAQTALELGIVYGDRFRATFETEIEGFWNMEGLRRVIENLAINAVKYGDPLAPIQINIRKDDQDVYLSVHNEGNPLTAQEKLTLFNPHVRALLDRSKGKPGWGLGLTLVRGITEAHGGDIRVTSSRQEGTTFTVRLPRDSRLRQV